MSVFLQNRLWITYDEKPCHCKHQNLQESISLLLLLPIVSSIHISSYPLHSALTILEAHHVSCIWNKEVEEEVPALRPQRVVGNPVSSGGKVMFFPPFSEYQVENAGVIAKSCSGFIVSRTCHNSYMSFTQIVSVSVKMIRSTVPGNTRPGYALSKVPVLPSLNLSLLIEIKR